MNDSPKTPFGTEEAMKGMAEASTQAVNVFKQGLDSWAPLLAPVAAAGRDKVNPRDKRFAGPEWEHPVFDLMRQAYSVMSDYMIGTVENLDGVPPEQKARIAFAMRTIVEAMSPANSPFTNPIALNRAIETKGQSLMAGMTHMMDDMRRGQLSHVADGAFKLGENIAVTPGKVVYQTRLFQLIQYTPATESVLKTPLVIFPPWINRFYILDLTAEKSFIKWCVDQGITVFMVSWKSADASMADVIWDDYISAQIDAIETIRKLLDVKSVHAIGYCVAGTTLAATLAVLAARGDADRVKSATFFTAQVDFTRAGDLLNFIDDAQLQLIEGLATDGYLDGRYLAATFNLLRGKDLIWSTVVSSYLLGDDNPAFDLLHWNGDVTNLPAQWHRDYLVDLYRDNKLAQPGALSALGVPIDLSKVKTPAYIQAGREDHIAPLESVWKIRDHFSGPLTFLLAGSGHIAGVVNPPAAHKYQYWTNEAEVGSLAEFIAGATETKGSWWPHWLEWLKAHGHKEVPADGARVPGEGSLPPLEDAPGSYVKLR